MSCAGNFYQPTERGYEKTIGERMRWIESLRRPATPLSDGTEPPRDSTPSEPEQVPS